MTSLTKEDIQSNKKDYLIINTFSGFYLGFVLLLIGCHFYAWKKVVL